MRLDAPECGVQNRDAWCVRTHPRLILCSPFSVPPCPLRPLRFNFRSDLPMSKGTPARLAAPFFMTTIETWFAAKGWQPFDYQRQAWAAYRDGRSGLVHAPTGMGKSYAVWLGIVDEWLAEHPDPAAWPREPEPLRALWITPMRALASDTLVSLQAPIIELDIPWTVDRRTGDTSDAIRRQQKKRLPTALVTTPESLSLLLSYPDARERLAHACGRWWSTNGTSCWATKRGVQTELALARLRSWNPALRTWGLSATLGNLDEALEVLLGRPRRARPRLEAWGQAPSRDRTAAAGSTARCLSSTGYSRQVRVAHQFRQACGTGPVRASQSPPRPQVQPQARASRGMIISGASDQAAVDRNDRAGRHRALSLVGPFGHAAAGRSDLADRIGPHHACCSPTPAARPKSGFARCCGHGPTGRPSWPCTTARSIATCGRMSKIGCGPAPFGRWFARRASIWGSIFRRSIRCCKSAAPRESPGCCNGPAASGHQPGALSRVVCVPTHAFELIEFAAAREAALAGQIEGRDPIDRPLDVLAQHLVTIALGGGFTSKKLFDEVRTTHAFRRLSRFDWQWVLDFVTRGGPALQGLSAIRPHPPEKGALRRRPTPW